MTAVSEVFRTQKYLMSRVVEEAAGPVGDLVNAAKGEPIAHYADPGGPLLRGWRALVDGSIGMGRIREGFEGAEEGARIAREIPNHPLADEYLLALEGVKADRALIRSAPGTVPQSLENLSSVLGKMREFALPQFPV